MPAKIYNAAPLPFMGQKRRFVNQFREALHDFPTTAVFVDLFGGSGLLSHITKRERPDARVIYNDYDDFHLRVENIERTNAIIDRIRVILADAPREKKVDPVKRQSILDLLEQHERTGYIDYITVSSSILFSGKYATCLSELQRQTFYNVVKQSPYPLCTDYLDGLEIVKYDYRELFARFKDVPNVAFLVDPPYLSTQAGHYSGYWKLADYLDVFQTILEHPYVYFTSNKSSVVESFDWMNAHGFGSPFKEAVRKEVRTSINCDAQYTDIMIYRP